MSFTLTDTTQVSCHGTSFKSLAEAKNYAISLQEFGLCETYSVGEYRDGKYVNVYKSDKEYNGV